MKAKGAADADVRCAAVAGMFYPGDAGELEGTLRGLFRGGREKSAAAVRGVIAPHAGYAYSGETAAAAYGRIAGNEYETVVVIAPSHREFFEGVSVYPGRAYSTPLGTLPIDAALREALTRSTPFVRASLRGHGAEHAVEVHLPFLQHLLGEFPLLPLVVGHQTSEVCFGLGRALGALLGKRSALLVASTDLSHFHEDREARTIDEVVLADVRAFDPGALMTHLEEGTAEACGGGPTVAALAALRILGATSVHVVAYATSGDVTGDRRSVVGYMSAVAF
ncbi:MAG TPA: AmmeMemoRadiSam system protein B [Bacteroidota bacterium]|nr:AmmeMemoRadiSam system protein B [Bacteroidota bacterium]